MIAKELDLNVAITHRNQFDVRHVEGFYVGADEHFPHELCVNLPGWNAGRFANQTVSLALSRETAAKLGQFFTTLATLNS